MNEELYEINHPSLICPNIEADLYSQAQEYNIDFDSLVSKNDYLYLKDQFISCVKKNDIKIEIPRIIHQIYFDQSGPPAYLLDISQSWKELNPDWEYKFWNGNDVNSFIQEYYPELIPAYNSLRYDVQRWDAIRYLILYKMGGLYVDMDYECTETITPILCNTICAMGLEPNGHAIRIYKPYIVGNAFMATIPGHPYFKEIIDEVFYRKGQECLETDELVLNTTGPYMTTRLYDKSLYKDQITLIPSELIAPLTSRDVGNFLKGNKSLDFEAKIEKSFAVHYFLGSWTNQVNS